MTSFLGRIVLARLLLPEDFGTFALALATINLLGALQIKKIGATLIQRLNQIGDKPSEHRKVIGTTFSVRIISSTTLFLATYFLSPALITILQKESLILPVKILSVLFLLEGLRVVPRNLMLWELDFRRYVLTESLSRIVQVIAAVLFALSGTGVWSFIYAKIIADMVLVALSWLFKPIRPTHIDLDEAERIIGFTIPLWLSSLLILLRDVSDKWILGVFLDEQYLGYYSLAYGLALLPVGFTNYFVSVGYPIFSKIQMDRERLRRSVEMGIKYTLILILPATTGMILLAHPIIDVIYTAKWMPMLGSLMILCLAAPFSGLNNVLLPVFIAINRPRFDLLISATRIILLVLIGPPMTRWFGLTGFCITLVATEASILGLSLYEILRILKLKVQFLKPLAASLSMGTLLYLIPENLISGVIPLLIVIMISSVCYMVILTLLEGREFINENIDLVYRVFLEIPAEDVLREE